MLDAVEEGVEAEGGEVAVRGRDGGPRHPQHVLLGATAVGDEVGDGDHREVVVLGEHPQLVGAGHLAVDLLRHDLAEHARRAEARQPGEVDRGLGVTGPAQHAALAGAQWQHVPGAHEVRGGRLGVGEHPDRVGAVVGRDAGGHALAGVDGHGERRAEVVAVGMVHRRQVQAIALGLGQRHADVARGVADHERQQLGGGELGREDQVALVLPVRVVHHHHGLARLDVGDGPLDGLKFIHRHSPPSPASRRTWQ